MSTLKKIGIVRYLDADRKQVTKGTPGSKRIKVTSKEWYGRYKNSVGKWVKVRLFTDKEASATRLAEMMKAQARGETHLTDPHAETKTLVVTDAMVAYLDEL